VTSPEPQAPPGTAQGNGRRRRSLVALGALGVLGLASIAAAQAPSTDLETLVAAAQANYSPPRHLQLEASDLASAALIQAHAALPRVGVEQSLRWRGYEAFDLHLALDASVPLFRARAAPIAELQAERERDHAARAAADNAAARAEFLADALALALVLRLEADSGRALQRFRLEVWTPPTDPDHLFALPPPERELLELFRSVEGLSDFSRQHVSELTKRLAQATGGPVNHETWPTFDQILAAIDLEPPTRESCVEAAPDARAATSRHRQRLLDIAVDRTLDVQVNLVGSLGYDDTLGLGAPPGANSTRAQLGLEARIYLPDGWPVTADVSARMGLDGAEQSLRVDWPPTPSGPDAAAAAARADLDLADELEYLEGQVTASLRARDDALASVHEAETRLLWLARDHHAAGSSLASARAAAWAQFPDPVIDLYAVSHRADLAFAQLALARTALDLQVLCGTVGHGIWPEGLGSRAEGHASRAAGQGSLAAGHGSWGEGYGSRTEGAP